MNKLILVVSMKKIGEIEIESNEAVVLGKFTDFDEYIKYAELFSNLNEAINNQELVEVDRLEKIISRIDFKVTDSDGSNVRDIHDLQISSFRINFRWGARPESDKDLYRLSESVHDKASFIKFIIALREDRQDELAKRSAQSQTPHLRSPNGWENDTIENFLDSMAEWADATNALSNKPMVSHESSWKSFAMILHAGKFYE